MPYYEFTREKNGVVVHRVLVLASTPEAAIRVFDIAHQIGRENDLTPPPEYAILIQRADKADAYLTTGS